MEKNAMSFISEYLSNTWIIPAEIISLTLLFIFATWFVSRYFKAIKISSPFFPCLQSQITHEEHFKNDIRQHQRIEVDGIRADISDGKSSYSGLITNISTLGLCIKNVPDTLSTSRSFLSIIVRGSKEEYRIVARPRWEQAQNNIGKTIGAEIASSPNSWSDFILSH